MVVFVRRVTGVSCSFEDFFPLSQYSWASWISGLVVFDINLGEFLCHYDFKDTSYFSLSHLSRLKQMLGVCLFLVISQFFVFFTFVRFFFPCFSALMVFSLRYSGLRFILQISLVYSKPVTVEIFGVYCSAFAL